MGFGFILNLKIEAAKTWVSVEEHHLYLMGLFIFEAFGAIFGGLTEFLIGYFDLYDYGYLIYFSSIIVICIGCAIFIKIKNAPPFPPTITEQLDTPRMDQI